jgi:hypothetical protein
VSSNKSRRKGSTRKPPPSRQAQARGRATAKRPSAPPPRAGSARIRWIAGGLVAVIAIALVVAVVGGSSNSNSTKPDTLVPKYGRAPAPASVVDAVTSVPANVIDQVGLGSGKLPTPINDGAPGAKPDVLFVGAEFCPFCAADRWSIVNALSRFGTFSGLKVTHSSATDVDANTETFSFYGSTYTSKYISFSPVETTTNEPSNGYYKLLQNPTAAQQQIWLKYTGTGGFPFLYFGKRFYDTNTYDPGVLAGKTHAQIAAALKDPTSAIAKGAIGTANGFTAAICSLTNDQPASACTVPSITDLEHQLVS